MQVAEIAITAKRIKYAFKEHPEAVEGNLRVFMNLFCKAPFWVTMKIVLRHIIVESLVFESNQFDDYAYFLKDARLAKNTHY